MIPGSRYFTPSPSGHFLIMWMEMFSCVKCRHVQRHITHWVECIGLASQPITSYKLKEWLQWLALKKNTSGKLFSGTGLQSNQTEESFEGVSTVLSTPFNLCLFFFLSSLIDWDSFLLLWWLRSLHRRNLFNLTNVALLLFTLLCLFSRLNNTSQI